MIASSTFLKLVIVNISTRTITLVGDDNTQKIVEFEDIDSFVARRQFIEEHKIGFDIQYIATVQ